MLKLARRARGHFMTLIEIRVHLIRCKPGHISQVQGGTLQTLSLLPALRWVEQREIVCLLYEGLYLSCIVG